MASAIAHGLLHGVATVVALPYVALAALFALVGQVAREKGLWSVLDTFLTHALWWAEWGMYAVPLAALVLIMAGFVPKARRAAAHILVGASATSLLTILALHSGPLDAGQWVFLVPCGSVIALGLWLGRGAGPERLRA